MCKDKFCRADKLLKTTRKRVAAVVNMKQSVLTALINHVVMLAYRGVGHPRMSDAKGQSCSIAAAAHYCGRGYSDDVLINKRDAGQQRGNARLHAAIAAVQRAEVCD